MTEDTFRAVLETAQAKPDKEGWHALPEGRLLTLYTAHDGVSLVVTKVERVRQQKALVHARNAKGETFLLCLEDVFAASTDSSGERGGAGGRKAGFLG